MEHSTSRNRPAETMTERDIREATVGEPSPVNGQITVVPYNPTWPEVYAREETRICTALGDRVVQLDHIGSTAVPGLAAKPVIDVQLLVEDSGDESAYADALIEAGYILRIREPEWEEHRVFKGTNPNVNLHVFSRGSKQAARRLCFRAHDADRDLYAGTKLKLAAQNWVYVQNYADAKNEVVDEILHRAGWTAPRI